MNRVLYQLSYAAIGQIPAIAEISFVIIYSLPHFVKGNLRNFQDFFGDISKDTKTINLRPA